MKRNTSKKLTINDTASSTNDLRLPCRVLEEIKIYQKTIF